MSVHLQQFLKAFLPTQPRHHSLLRNAGNGKRPSRPKVVPNLAQPPPFIRLLLGHAEAEFAHQTPYILARQRRAFLRGSRRVQEVLAGHLNHILIVLGQRHVAVVDELVQLLLRGETL